MNQKNFDPSVNDREKSPAIANWKTLLSGKTNQTISRKSVGNAVVVLLIDTSYSMEGDSLREAKFGALEFISNALAKNYAVGLIGFGSESYVVSEPITKIGPLSDSLENLISFGSTDMASALSAGLTMLKDYDFRRAICLVTDGYPDDEQSALDMANLINRNDIDILTLGTEDADNLFLSKLASRHDLSTSGTARTLKLDMGRMAGLLPG